MVRYGVCSHLWFDTTQKRLTFLLCLFLFTGAIERFENISDKKRTMPLNANILKRFVTKTQHSREQSSRVTSLYGKLGPSHATFFKGKGGYFPPEKTDFQTVLTSFILKIVLYTYQTPKNREKFFSVIYTLNKALCLFMLVWKD